MNKLIAAAVILIGCATPLLAETQRMITVTGQGSVETVPDMASIRIGVTREARLAGEALDATSGAVRDVIARLEEAGIAPRDMQTQGLSLQPKWVRPNAGDGGEPRITGFIARNSLSIRVRELEALGGILNEVVEDGANTFDGLQFSLADPDAAIAAARADAVADAIAKAEQLSQAAGVSLGSIQSISESGGAPRPAMMEMASARMANDVPVAQGEVSLTARVTIEFAIAD